MSEGGQIIDIGGYSSRPDAEEVSPEEEMERLVFALKILNAHYPEAVVSVDTFRADVARKCVEDYGVAIINDISGGELDPAMFGTVAGLNVPYIMMHMRGTPQTMQQHTGYTDMMEEIMLYFASKVRELRLLGVNDIILDPGFGFSKTVDHELPFDESFTGVRRVRSSPFSRYIPQKYDLPFPETGRFRR